jgi:hypothetical protein
VIHNNELLLIHMRLKLMYPVHIFSLNAWCKFSLDFFVAKNRPDFYNISFNYIATKAKMLPRKLPWQGTLRQVFLRVYRLDSGHTVRSCWYFRPALWTVAHLTCKVPLQVNFLDDDILQCLLWVLSRVLKKLTSKWFII